MKRQVKVRSACQARVAPGRDSRSRPPGCQRRASLRLARKLVTSKITTMIWKCKRNMSPANIRLFANLPDHELSCARRTASFARELMQSMSSAALETSLPVAHRPFVFRRFRKLFRGPYAQSLGGTIMHVFAEPEAEARACCPVPLRPRPRGG